MFRPEDYEQYQWYMYCLDADEELIKGFAEAMEIRISGEELKDYGDAWYNRREKDLFYLFRNEEKDRNAVIAVYFYAGVGDENDYCHVVVRCRKEDAPKVQQAFRRFVETAEDLYEDYNMDFVNYVNDPYKNWLRPYAEKYNLDIDVPEKPPEKKYCPEEYQQYQFELRTVDLQPELIKEIAEAMRIRYGEGDIKLHQDSLDRLQYNQTSFYLLRNRYVNPHAVIHVEFYRKEGRPKEFYAKLTIRCQNEDAEKIRQIIQEYFWKQGIVKKYRREPDFTNYIDHPKQNWLKKAIEKYQLDVEGIELKA